MEKEHKHFDYHIIPIRLNYYSDKGTLLRQSLQNNHLKMKTNQMHKWESKNG